MMAVVGLAVLAAGCGGKDEPKRSALAENLAQLCEQARADTEALGLPAEKGFKVMKPTAAIGLRLAADVKKLAGHDRRREGADRLARRRASLLLQRARGGGEALRGGHPEVYAITLGRAKPSLESAEALATRMGAPECAVRPFPDR